MKNKTQNIVIILLIIISIMAIGYATFATQLTINGTAKIVGEWDVKITNIIAKNVSDGCNAGTPTFTNVSATFNAELEKPGDSITYEITIENAGTIDAVLSSITFKEGTPNGSPAIIYTNTEPISPLPAGQETTFTVTVSYDEEATEIPEITTKTITGIIEYEQE